MVQPAHPVRGDPERMRQQPPRIALLRRRVEGGRDALRVGDTTVRITDQPGLQANPRRWTPTGACAR